MSDGMSVIIGKDGVKRKIEAPFNLCLGNEAFHALLNALLLQRAKLREEEREWCYGWIEVTVPTVEPPVIGERPIGWLEEPASG